MIRCRLELIPGGVGEPELLGEIMISNNIFTTIRTEGKRGTYEAVIYKKRRRPWTSIEILDFPRLSYHPWEMIRRALNEAALKNGGHI